jgi:hydroxymethylbilane synthase
VSRALRIGTRGSRLARAQAGWVRRRLEELRPGMTAELVVIHTSGDRFLAAPLSAIGGKGLFVKEIEESLCRGDIDCAVHSMKDLPLDLAAGLEIAAVPRRENPYDVVVTRGPGGLEALGEGARVGTSSLRRAALVRSLDARLEVVALRGNVDTRLRKLEEGEVDAILLAAAGLARMGIEPPHVTPCDGEHFVPAIGQGALAIEARGDSPIAVLAELDDRGSRTAIEAERALLAEVGGSCVTPLAAHATLAGGQLTLRGLIAAPDGSNVVRGRMTGAAEEGPRLGRALGRRLLDEGGAEILAALEGRQ